MHILLVTDYIHSLKSRDLSKQKTGLATITRSLAIELGKKNTVEVFCIKVPVLKKVSEMNFSILENMKGISLSAIKDIIKIYKKHQIQIVEMTGGKNIIYSLLYVLYLAELRKIITTREIDVVHFNSSKKTTYIGMKLCEQFGIKYIITIHNYFGNKSSVNGYKEMKQFEKIIIKESIGKICVVSSGVKKRIVNDLGEHIENKIQVIINGNGDGFQINDNSRFDLPFNKNNTSKVLLFPGTISERKNQIGLVKTYAKFDDNLKNRVKVVFCGDDTLDGQLISEIRKNRLENNMYYVGTVNLAEMPKLYSICDGVILCSKNESFGLVYIEGFLYGLPGLIYNDLDAFEELFDKNVMVDMDREDPESIKKAVRLWSEKEWNVNYIKEYAKKFSIQRTAQRYMNVYQESHKMS